MKPIDWATAIVAILCVVVLLVGLLNISARDDQEEEDLYGINEARRS